MVPVAAVAGVVAGSSEQVVDATGAGDEVVYAARGLPQGTGRVVVAVLRVGPRAPVYLIAAGARGQPSLRVTVTDDEIALRSCVDLVLATADGLAVR